MRGELGSRYVSAPRKRCLIEILEALNAFNAKGRTVWKSMHIHKRSNWSTFLVFSRRIIIQIDEAFFQSELVIVEEGFYERKEK